MSEVGVQVKILVDTLEKKKQLLTEIDNYTKEQANILSAPDLDLRAFNNIMSNKQVRIDLLMRIDDGFEATFDRVKTVLTTQPGIYKEAILKMKTLIKEVNDLGVSIQVQEQRNKLTFDTKTKSMKSEVKNFRNHKSAMNVYQNNYAKMKKADQPQFFDSKK